MRSISWRRSARPSSIQPRDTSSRRRSIASRVAGIGSSPRQFLIVFGWTPCFWAARLSPKNSASSSARAMRSTCGGLREKVCLRGATHHAAIAARDTPRSQRTKLTGSTR